MKPALTAETLPEAPSGFTWAYNRLPEPYADQFDGRPYEFKSREYRLLPLDVANFLCNQSVISLNMAAGKGKRAITILGQPDFGVPSDQPKGDELIDRSTGDNPIGRGTGGVKTRAAKVAVPG